MKMRLWPFKRAAKMPTLPPSPTLMEAMQRMHELALARDDFGAHNYLRSLPYEVGQTVINRVAWEAYKASVALPKE